MTGDYWTCNPIPPALSRVPHTRYARPREAVEGYHSVIPSAAFYDIEVDVEVYRYTLVDGEWVLAETRLVSIQDGQS